MQNDDSTNPPISSNVSCFPIIHPNHINESTASLQLDTTETSSKDYTQLDSYVKIGPEVLAPDPRISSLEQPWLMNEGFGPFVPAEKERILGCRRVTDVWVTPFGTIVFLWMFYLLCQTLGVSDPRRLSHGYDYRGRLCGVDIPNEPYVYWPLHPLTKTIDLVSPLCINKCPSQADFNMGMMISYPNRTATTEILPDGREITHITVQPISVPAYPSRKFGGEYCFPLNLHQSKILAKALGLTDEWMVVTRVFKSIKTGWIFLVISGFIAILFSFSYLLFVADIAWLICWVTSSMAPLCLLFGSIYLGMTAATAESSSMSTLAATLDWVPVKGLLVGFSISGIVTSIFLLVSDSHLKQHSRKAVALAQATSHCLWSAPNVLIYPVVGTAVAVFVWAIGIMVFIGLLTSPGAVPQARLVPDNMKLDAISTLDPPLIVREVTISLDLPSNHLFDYLSLHNKSSDRTHDFPMNSSLIITRRPSMNPIKHVVATIEHEVGSNDVTSIISDGSVFDPVLVNEGHNLHTTYRSPIITTQLSAMRQDYSDSNGKPNFGKQHWLRSLGNNKFSEQTDNQTFGILRQFRWDLTLHWSCWLWAISILWLLEVVHNLTQFMISFTAAMWYFTVPDIRGFRDDIGISGFGCLWVALRYHLGTLQLSALVLSTFRWLQFAAWSIRQRIKLSTQRIDYQRRCSLFLGFLQGILKSVEDTSRYLNAGGLVECVLHSKDFLPSCRRAWDLIHQQIPSVIILGRVSSALSLLNSIGLASTMSGLVLYISNRFSLFNDPTSTWFVDSPAGLAAATFGLVAVIAHLVVFSFDQMSSTLLYCLLMESQNQSGVVVFAPDELRILVEEQESERRLEELQRAVPDRSILSLSMMAASRGPESLDQLVLSDISKPDEGRWKETIQHFKDDDGLYQSDDNRSTSVRTFHHSRALNSHHNRNQSTRQIPSTPQKRQDSALEMNDVRW